MAQLLSNNRLIGQPSTSIKWYNRLLHNSQVLNYNISPRAAPQVVVPSSRKVPAVGQSSSQSLRNGWNSSSSSSKIFSRSCRGSNMCVQDGVTHPVPASAGGNELLYSRDTEKIMVGQLHQLPLLKKMVDLKHHKRGGARKQNSILSKKTIVYGL